MFITDPELLEKFYTPQRLWQGIPGIEVTPGGRIFAAFYSGGTREDIGNFAVLVQSDDGGQTFTEPIAAAYEDGRRCYDPCLWIDPRGRLWFFWSYMPRHAVYACVCDDPDAPTLSWHEPRFIGRDVMMNRPTVLSTGEWLFPIAVWSPGVRALAPKYDTETVPDGAFVYKSADNGNTITEFGRADMPGRSYDEHMILEKQDMSLLMLIRTKTGIGASYSYDRGRTWSRGEDSGIAGPSSRFFIRRLKSGRVLLINHHHFSGRNNLTALLSDDDGATWPHRLLLDGRSNVSYPDAVEDAGGNIHIIYDRQRGAFKNSLQEVYDSAREILLARVTEEDILQGKLVCEGSFLKRIVSKLGVYAHEHNNPFGETNRFSDEDLAAWVLKDHEGEAAVEKLFELYPLNCRSLHKFDAQKLDRLADRLCTAAGDSLRILTDIVTLIRNTYANGAPESPVVSGVMREIGESIDRDISVLQLAEKFDISVHYLCHLFKQSTGMSIIQYRNAQRMALAKKMLIETSRKISDIALACGYNGYSYFTEVFVHEESMTPSRFRKLHRK